MNAATSLTGPILTPRQQPVVPGLWSRAGLLAKCRCPWGSQCVNFERFPHSVLMAARGRYAEAEGTARAIIKRLAEHLGQRREA